MPSPGRPVNGLFYHTLPALAEGSYITLKRLIGRGGSRVMSWLKNLPFIRTAIQGAQNLLGQMTIPFNAATLLMGMTMLNVATNGTVSFSGTLPLEGYENATFKCEMGPFEESGFFSVSKGVRLLINGQVVPGGGCKFRKVSIPYFFIDMWDGEIKLNSNSKTRFQLHENAMEKSVKTGFSQIVNSNEDVEIDFSSFQEFDKNLGSTKDFSINNTNGIKWVRVAFSIEKIGHFDIEMKANETFEDTSYPMIGIYQFENDEASFHLNLRREEVPFYIVTNGIIDFKQPKHGIKAIIFATDGQEMRFQGKSVDKVTERGETSTDTRSQSKVRNSPNETPLETNSGKKSSQAITCLWLWAFSLF